MSAKYDSEDIEKKLLVVHASRAATAAKEAGFPDSGAIVVFHVAVPAPSNTHMWSLDFDDWEPGSVFPANQITNVKVHTKVEGWDVTGVFQVAVGDVNNADRRPAAYKVTQNQKPVAESRSAAWVDLLPKNIDVIAVPKSSLERQEARMARQARQANEDLAAHVIPLVQQFASQRRGALARRSSVMDTDDFTQDLMRAAWVVIDSFASPRRPAVSWGKALHVALTRDAGRSIVSMDIGSEASAKAQVWHDHHPEITDPEEARMQWAFELRREELSRKLKGTPLAEIEAMIDRSTLKPPVSYDVMKAVIERPAFVSIDAPGSPGNVTTLADSLANPEDATDHRTATPESLRIVEQLGAHFGPAARDLAGLASGEDLANDPNFNRSDAARAHDRALSQTALAAKLRRVIAEADAEGGGKLSRLNPKTNKPELDPERAPASAAELAVLLGEASRGIPQQLDLRVETDDDDEQLAVPDTAPAFRRNPNRPGL